jgi:hypothetical protein
MYKIISLIAVLITIVSVNELYSEENDDSSLWWDNYTSPMGFEITNVEIQQVQCRHDHSEKAGAQAVPGMFVNGAFTSTVDFPWDEHYTFSGGGSANVDHVISFCVGSSREVCFALAWQPCGNEVIFPPLPLLKGTLLDGERFCLTVPSGCYDIGITATGFDVGEWDWMAMANYDGAGPIHPLSPDTDTFGGSKNSLVLYDIGDGVGHGLSAGRPWCFEITP